MHIHTPLSLCGHLAPESLVLKVKLLVRALTETIFVDVVIGFGKCPSSPDPLVEKTWDRIFVLQCWVAIVGHLCISIIKSSYRVVDSCQCYLSGGSWIKYCHFSVGTSVLFVFLKIGVTSGKQIYIYLNCNIYISDLENYCSEQKRGSKNFETTPKLLYFIHSWL